MHCVCAIKFDILSINYFLLSKQGKGECSKMLVQQYQIYLSDLRLLHLYAGNAERCQKAWLIER